MSHTFEIFTGKGYGALIFLSCIEKPKNRTDITKDWGLALNARPLYRPGVEPSIQNLINEGLLEKTKDEKLFSSFKGLPKVLKQLVKSNEEIDKKLNLIVSFTPFFELLEAKHAEVIAFLNKPWVREEILNTENIKKYFNDSIELTRKQGISPITYIPFAAYLYGEKAKGKQDFTQLFPIISAQGGFNFAVYYTVCEAAFEKHKNDLAEVKNISIDLLKAVSDVLK